MDPGVYVLFLSEIQTLTRQGTYFIEVLKILNEMWDHIWKTLVVSSNKNKKKL